MSKQDKRDEALHLVKTMVMALVEDRDQVDIVVEEAGKGFLFRVTCAQADVGKLIGRNGRNAKALKAILLAASGSARNRIPFELDLVDYDIPGE